MSLWKNFRKNFFSKKFRRTPWGRPLPSPDLKVICVIIFNRHTHVSMIVPKFNDDDIRPSIASSYLRFTLKSWIYHKILRPTGQFSIKKTSKRKMPTKSCNISKMLSKKCQIAILPNPDILKKKFIARKKIHRRL